MDYNRLCRGCFHELPKTGAVCPHCGFDENQYERNRKPDILPLNTILRGSYIVGRCLGKGGFGITYIGWHINLDLVVAIKEFFPAGMVSRDTMNPDPQKNASVTLTNQNFNQPYRKSMQSFMKEAKILGRLHMPGVVGVHDCFEENNTVYLVMDYISGCDLKTYVRNKGGRISEEETLNLMHPVIKSLQELHEKNVLHRDISPENILVNENGEAILVDFGAARNKTAEAAGEQGKSMTVVLKPGYAPMEQYNIHGNQGPWTDVYALCSTMYRMLTGSILNDPIVRNNTDDDEQIIRQNLKNNSVSARTINVLIKGLQLRVKDRYQSMQELENVLYSTGRKAPVASKQPTKPFKSGKGKRIAFISIVALLIIAAVIGIVSSRKSDDNKQKQLAAQTESQKASEKDTQKTTETNSEPVTQIVTEPETQKDSEIITQQSSEEETQLTSETASEMISEKETDATIIGQWITEEPITEEQVTEEPATEKTYLLTVEGGIIQGTNSSTGSFHEGEHITIQPEKRDNYTFTGWSVSNDNVITQMIGSDLRFAMPAESFTVTAEYEELTYSVTVKNGNILDGEDSGYYREGTVITIQAEKKDGYDFAGWYVEQGSVTLEDADAEETSFTMGKEDVVVSAIFVQKTYILVVNGGTLQGTDSSTGSFHEGELITVEPEEREHYVFTGWNVSDDDVIVQPIDNTLRFAMPAEGFTVTAEFEKAKHTVSVENGTILGGESTGSFEEDTEISIKADDRDGYDFSGWAVKQGDITLKNAADKETSFVMGNNDVIVSASFTQKTYQLSVVGGTIQGQKVDNGSFHEGDQITIEPEKKEGYEFTGWTVSDETVDIQLDGDNLKITMPAKDITVTAGFEEIEPELFSEKEKNCKVGDIITFGSYEQDNNISNGSEPVEWLVLDKDGNKALVISKYALDAKQYNSEHIDGTVTWKTCDLRRWLNEDFYHEAFSIEEQKQIEETVVNAEDNEDWGTDAGNDTRDKVFLLSISDVEDLFEDDDARVCYPTRYTIAQGAMIVLLQEGSCWWWLRSPGSYSIRAAYVRNDGKVHSNGHFVDNENIGVRPAMWINLE